MLVLRQPVRDPVLEGVADIIDRLAADIACRHGYSRVPESPVLSRLVAVCMIRASERQAQRDARPPARDAAAMFSKLVRIGGGAVSDTLCHRPQTRRRALQKALPPGTTTPLDQAIPAAISATNRGLPGVRLDRAEHAMAFAYRAATATAALVPMLDVQYYIWHDDLTGKLLGSRAAACGGARRAAADCLSTSMRAPNTTLFLVANPASEPVAVRIFNPFYSRKGIACRSFRKC